MKEMLNKTRTSLFCVGGCCLLLASAAAATPTASVSVQTSGGAMGVPGTTPCVNATNGITASASCTTTAGFFDTGGQLSVSSVASASAGPGVLRVGTQGTILPFGGAAATANAYYSEALTLTIPGAAAGSTGTLTGGFVINGGLGATATGSPLATNAAQSALTFQASFGSVNVATQGSSFFSTATNQTTYSPFATSLPVTWTFTVGPGGVVSGSISGYAQAQISASASIYRETSNSPVIPGFASSSASFSDTLYWSGITSLTLGGQPVTNFSVTSDSGFDYVKGYTPPVPEPETYAMMLAGLCLMGFVVRRRKQA